MLEFGSCKRCPLLPCPLPRAACGRAPEQTCGGGRGVGAEAHQLQAGHTSSPTGVGECRVQEGGRVSTQSNRLGAAGHPGSPGRDFCTTQPPIPSYPADQELLQGTEGGRLLRQPGQDSPGPLPPQPPEPSSPFPASHLPSHKKSTVRKHARER